MKQSARVEVYNMKCSQQVTFETDFSFEDAQFLSNHEVCLTSENACALYTLAGVKNFTMNLKIVCVP